MALQIYSLVSGQSFPGDWIHSKNWLSALKGTELQLQGND
jgi:hypothetical protein